MHFSVDEENRLPTALTENIYFRVLLDHEHLRRRRNQQLLSGRSAIGFDSKNGGGLIVYDNNCES